MPLEVSDEDIAGHYRHGALEARLLEALAAAGRPLDRLTPGDLMGADEFHIGAAQATGELLAQLQVTPQTDLVDIGCGLGGAARHIAAAVGCRVVGVDLSAEYVAVAASLAARMGLSRVEFRQANATGLPFRDESFDAAVLLHVGMNIADKAKLFAGVHRVLRPGGRFAVYDVMRVGPGPLRFPLPWSSMAETTILESPDTYRDLLRAAGFVVTGERNRAALGRRFFAVAARQLETRPEPLGLQLSRLIHGEALPLKIANMSALLDGGVIAPVEMIVRRPA